MAWSDTGYCYIDDASSSTVRAHAKYDEHKTRMAKEAANNGETKAGTGDDVRGRPRCRVHVPAFVGVVRLNSKLKTNEVSVSMRVFYLGSVVTRVMHASVLCVCNVACLAAWLQHGDIVRKSGPDGT